MSNHPRGQTPTPVAPGHYDNAGDVFSMVTPADPLPVTDTATQAAIAAAASGPSPAAAVAAVVGVTNASQVLVAADANRQSLFVYNPSAVTVYVSNTNPAVIATSIPIPTGGHITRDPGSGSKLAWWVIAAVAGPNSIHVESVA